jgi:two-component system, NtrC family, nitrogen regulation sensor histidine kinase NtrY
MLHRLQTLLRLDKAERRLFGWLLLLSVVPILILLGAGYLITSRSLQWVGTLGPWDSVAESGRTLFDAAESAARSDSALAAAIDAHRRELSNSLVLARRWNFIGERVAALLPYATFTVTVLLVVLALWVGRRLSVQLTRPIRELAGWAALMAADEPLPAPQPRERGEVRELRALRKALRKASTQIRAARARALETERVRAWGEMARRVAHEMKNPLTPLRLAAHRLAAHPDARSALREPLEVIGEETERLEELARQFAVLGRPSAGPASAIDLHELLERLLESDVPPHIATRLDVAPDVPMITAHYDAVQRALRNLVRNAVEAVEAVEAVDGAARPGTDTTAGSADFVEYGERVERGERDGEIVVTVVRDDASVSITIADTGCGIPALHIDRLFEPDFTLKAGGTGLGLAVVRQAVAAHGGTVAARQREGGGAEFTIALPLPADADAART